MDMASNVTLEFLISVIYDYHNTFDMIFPGVKEMVILKLSQNKLNITPINFICVFEYNQSALFGINSTFMIPHEHD